MRRGAVSGSITSCQKVKFITCSAVNIVTNSLHRTGHRRRGFSFAAASSHLLRSTLIFVVCPTFIIRFHPRRFHKDIAHRKAAVFMLFLENGLISRLSNEVRSIAA